MSMSGQSSGGVTVVEDGKYTVRAYESRDLDGVHALSELVWGSDRSVEWLAYRYETNPYRDGPPMVVAETDGHVVGARPFVPLPMRVGHTDVTAVYLGNLMVHPEHRRQGLFTRMTELATELYADTDSDFFFNFANERSAPGYRKLDFEAVATGPEKQFRVQNPGQVVRDRMRLPAGRYLGVAADAAMDSYLSLRRRGPTRAGYEVERLSGIPAELVAELYEADHPTALHTRREETFYRWLANGPYWEYETYVASSDGTPAAAVVVRRRSLRRDGDVWLVDAVPPNSGEHRAAFRAVLDSVLADHREARVTSVLGPVVHEQLFSEETLREYGFLSSTHPLLSRLVGRDDTMFFHSLGGHTEGVPTVGGVDLRNPENWALRVS